ncbi:baseplate J/gp47 family protein [Peribacillus huizhouensis]|uniref:Phage protein gp47/JayE n=1 Tax=Peribacillus huizhouensis TaxID=1501239 RepID=A0ABR6CR45_9BACI|nr:baseplate J/gp47 family protein [Peribacillus huizhouensis]MBA9027509.1 putative phage protein gp47/JayE [Peribacillus huizhouensis]
MAFEDKTAELLHAAMLVSVDDSLDKREGSVVHDMTYPAAIELAHAYVELDSVLGLGFAETTEGIYLDLRAGEFGVARKQELKAQGSVTLTGPADMLVPSGTRVQTAQDVFFETLADVLLSGGTATVEAEAELGGVGGNVAAGTISALAPGPLYGVVTVTNSQAFSGGVDTEDDHSLLQRLKDRVQRPSTSGNANHYRQWALEVSGVGDVKVYPVWNGGNTVKVVLLSTSRRAPDQVVIDAATANIESNRPVGPIVTVVGASELAINVSATLTLEDGADLEDVSAQFSEALANYLSSIAFTDDLIRYTRIANLLLDIPTVIDYENMLVNGGAANIHLTDVQVGVAGAVAFT